MGRKSDARARISKTAFRLIYQRGYARTSVQDIARQAGVNVGSLYYFFPSKEQLAVACLREYLGQMERLATPTLGAGEDPLAALQKFFSRYCRFTQTLFPDRHHGCFFGNMAAEVSAALPEVQQTLSDSFERIRRSFVRLLDEGKARGQLRDDCDVEKLSWQLMAYLQGANLLAKAYGDRRLLRRFGRLLSDLLHPHLADAARSTNC